MSVRTERAAGVLTVTLDRPDAKNALDAGMLAALAETLQHAADAHDVRALVLRANGSAFCAGGDFAAFRHLMATDAPQDGSTDPIARANRAYGDVLERLANLPVPTLALVTGAAVGGGVGLVAAADFAFALPRASFRLPETTLGLPPAQVAPFVADRIGHTATVRMTVLGMTVDAAEAQRIGLVDRVYPDRAALDAALGETLAAIGRAEPSAIRATKRMLAHARRAERGVVLDAAAAAFADALRSGTAAEGLSALAERRSPAWHAALGEGLATRADDAP